MAGSPQTSQYFRRRPPPTPTPNWGRRKMRNYRRQMTHRGTPRNATERDGALKRIQSALESAIVWRISPKFPYISGARHPLPITQLWGPQNAKLPRAKKTHRGNPRNAARRDGMLKFSQPALESAIFRRTPSIPPIFPAPGALLPQRPIGGGAKCEITARKRRRGTPRSVTER